MAEVVLVAIGTQDTTHRRDVETKKPTTDGGKAANRIHAIKGLDLSVHFQVMYVF